MHSLRWRIASSYAVLLIVVIIALGVAITYRFEQILRSQAQEHVVYTMQDIVHAVIPPPNAFGLIEGSDQLLALESPDNLERWASPTSFVEVDDLRGYPLAKSFNMGAIQSFGAPSLSPHTPFVTREVTVGGRTFLVYSGLLISGNRGLIVQVGEPLDQLYRAFDRTRLSIIIILAIAVFAVALLSFVVASQVTGPINDLAKTMREIGSEGLHRRIRWKGRKDEIGELAAAFDDLLARLEEAFARERQFISDASH
jgi:HAMP domain-containing protein